MKLLAIACILFAFLATACDTSTPFLDVETSKTAAARLPPHPDDIFVSFDVTAEEVRPTEVIGGHSKEFQYFRDIPTPDPESWSEDYVYPTEQVVNAYPPPGNSVEFIMPAATPVLHEQEIPLDILTNAQVIYLPYAKVNFPKRGTESWEDAFVNPINKNNVKAQILDINPDFVRIPIYWKNIEPQNDSWEWPPNYDEMVDWLVYNDIVPMLTLKWTPDWALASGEDYGCGRPADVNEFAEFAGQVAAHFDEDEIYLEIWNEPDSQYGVACGQTTCPRMAGYFGCCGDENEINYGGDFYLSVLNAAYPVIKMANPNATVAAGALMMDESDTMRDYILSWGSSPNYDILTYHNYAWNMNEGPINFYNRYYYLRNLTDRPMMLDETAVVWNGICDSAHEQRSVDWANFVLSRSNLDGVSYFFLGPDEYPWMCVDMYYYTTPWTPKPVKLVWEQP